MNYISIKTIMNNLLEHPLLKDLTLDKVVRHTADFIQLVGMPEILENKETTLRVNKYKAELPCDFFELIQMKTKDNCVEHYFKKSTSSFKENCNNLYTYRIEGGKIWTSIESGDIDIAYRAIVLDDDGFPMLSNDIYFIKALESYIKKFYFKILFEMGDINRFQYNEIDNDYNVAIAQCVNHLGMPSPEDIANIKYMLGQFLPDHHASESGYKTLNIDIKPTVQ